MAIDVAFGRPDAERHEETGRSGTTELIVHRAILELGTPITRLWEAVGRIREHDDAPDWLLGELLGIGTDLARAKQLRESVSRFITKQRVSLGRVGLEGLLNWLRAECAESVARQGIQLEISREPSAPDVRADAFLLRCALRGLVRRAQNSLAPTSGGLIRVTAKLREENVHIIVSHQAQERPDVGSAASDDEPAELAIVEAVIEHFGGSSKLYMSGDNGNEATLVLPAQQDESTDLELVKPTAA